MQSFADKFVDVDVAATGLSSIDQNHASVVALVEIGTEQILLGADLPTTNSDHTGWRAIVNSQLRSQGRSKAFKVSHHGSETSQCDDVWKKMIEPGAIAVLTPFTSAELPRNDGIEWLKKQNASVYLTSPPTKVNLRRRREVTSKMRQVTKSVRSYKLPDDPGIVRLRKRHASDGNWTVELFGSAAKVA